MKKPELPPLLIQKSPSAYYVYTYHNQWDPEKKRSRRADCKKVGVVVSGQKEGRIRWDESFIDKHPDLAHFTCERKGKDYIFTPIDAGGITLQQALDVKKLNAGATWALDQIVAASPIGPALKKAFPQNNMHLKILSLAYFLILTENNNVSRYENFAETTRLPWPHPLSPSAVSRLFSGITASSVEKFIRNLQAGWIAEKQKSGVTDKPLLALDSTSISSYSQKLGPVERGRNKDEDNLPQINLLMLVDAKTGLPVFYRHYDGNVPDVLTVRRVIADNARLGFTNVMLVSDKGYSSTNNIEDCLRNRVSFIFNMKCGVKGSLVQSLIDEERKNLRSMNARDWFTRVSHVTRKIDWCYDPQPVAGKKACNNEKVPLYWHIYYDQKIHDAFREGLSQRIDRICQKLEEGTPLDENEQDLFGNIFVKDDKTGRVWVDDDKVEAKAAYKGYRVLLSDEEADARKAWIAYQERWVVEDTFKTLKSRLGCSRLRTSDNASMDGKIFVQFIATAISMMVRSRIRSYATERSEKERLQVVYESDGKILSTLNTIMQTRFAGGYYFNEVAGKRKKFFEALGVPVPGAEQESPNDVENDEQDEDTSGVIE
jgi:transposase